jgi:hypothetical protein
VYVTHATFHLFFFLMNIMNVQSREPGESFTPKPSKDAEMEKLMRSMSVST